MAVSGGTVGTEREARKAAAFEEKAAGQFGGKMLCVGSTAAIAEEQYLGAGAQCLSHRHGRARDSVEIGLVFEKRIRQGDVIV